VEPLKGQHFATSHSFNHQRAFVCVALDKGDSAISRWS
jgi:hypothetical protein